MAKFDAGKAVEPMEYDFTAFGGTAGIIPEPSNKQVEDFFNAIGKMAKDLGLGEDTKDPQVRARLAEFMAGLTDEDIAKYKEDVAKAVDRLCSGTPSGEEYINLPYRVQGAFSAWLASELRPEAARPATTL